MTAGAETVIHVRGLAAGYGSRQVLTGVDLAVRRGEILTIMGPSGCGKTTLLKLLIGLERPVAGTIHLLGEAIGALDEDRLARFRRRIGMCFQFGALLNSLTVGENLALPLRELRVVPESVIAMIVGARLAQVGLHGSAENLPNELSGGMRKRAGLARALVLDPELLFFDEPTSGLDPVTAAGLDRTILDVRRRGGTTMVVVTHDLASAFTISDRIVVLIDGAIRAEGSPREIEQCRDPAVAAFVGRRAAAAATGGDARFVAAHFDGVRGAQ
ncbi:MAG: ATP-binding cassette domain-containing protein [Planctomycetes bacterium]|nr:ATP-binding cassette domain-containing protein [Planctomycetota bacterium]